MSSKTSCIREESAFQIRVCVHIKDGEKVREAVLSPDIRGKITAYKYVLSESLGRAAERSSFGNSLRLFATVVMLRVYCVQSFRPTCPVVHVYTCPFIARKRRTDGQTERQKKRKRKKGKTRKETIVSSAIGSSRVSVVEVHLVLRTREKMLERLNERVGVIIERPRLDLIF